MQARPARILVLDDDVRVGKLLRRFLEREGYAADVVTSVAEARAQLAEQFPDLVILDLMLPDGNGLALASELRAQRDVGIIILSGKQDVVDRIVGLEIGADDYMTKPFDERELVARVRSVLRRVQAPSTAVIAAVPAGASSAATGPVPRPVAPLEDDESVRFDGWVLDRRSHELFDPAGEQVHLTSYEFQLLTTFLQRPNRVLSRDEILGAVAGRKWNPYDRSIDVLVGKLRKKLVEHQAKSSIIKTIRGSGYKFTARTEGAAASGREYLQG